MAPAGGDRRRALHALALRPAPRAHAGVGLARAARPGRRGPGARQRRRDRRAPARLPAHREGPRAHGAPARAARERDRRDLEALPGRRAGGLRALRRRAGRRARALRRGRGASRMPAPSLRGGPAPARALEARCPCAGISPTSSSSSPTRRPIGWRWRTASSGVTRSWAELERRSNALAAHLAERHAPGDKLAIYSHNRPGVRRGADRAR